MLLKDSAFFKKILRVVAWDSNLIGALASPNVICSSKERTTTRPPGGAAYLIKLLLGPAARGL